MSDDFGLAELWANTRIVRLTDGPEEVHYAARYRNRTGFDVDPTAPFYTAFNLFRVAAILQSIAARARDGVQTAGNASEIIQLIRPLARAAWRAAQEAGRPERG